MFSFDILYDILVKYDFDYLMMCIICDEVMCGLVDFGWIEDMLICIKGWIVFCRLDWIVFFVVLLIFEVGKVLV